MILIVHRYNSPEETYGCNGRAGDEEDLEAEGADVGDEAVTLSQIYKLESTRGKEQGKRTRRRDYSAKGTAAVPPRASI